MRKRAPTRKPITSSRAPPGVNFMDKKEFEKMIKKLTDEDLIKDNFPLGVPSPNDRNDSLLISAIKSSMLMQKRLKDSIEKFDKTTARYNKSLIALTLTLIVVALVQLIVSIVLSGFDPWMQVFIEVIALGIILYAVVKISKDLDKK